MNRDASVLIDEGMLLGVNGMEEYFVANLCIVSALQEVEQFAHLLRSVDVEFGGPSEQVHRSDEAWQPEDVVAMIVADEDVADAEHRQSHLLHLCLHTFAAVDHEVFAPHVQ